MDCLSHRHITYLLHYNRFHGFGVSERVGQKNTAAVVPIDVSKYCPRPKSMFSYLKLTMLYDFSEILNFFYTKVYQKYSPNKRKRSNSEADLVIEEICKKMIKTDVAVVSIYFPHGTYTRIEQTLKVTLTDKIASFGKFY